MWGKKSPDCGEKCWQPALGSSIMERTMTKQAFCKTFHHVAPGREERQEVIDSTLGTFIGNDMAKQQLSRAVYGALGKWDHCCADQFALLGRKSVGKTTLAKLFVKALGLPFVEINAQVITKLDDMAEEIRKACAQSGYPLQVVGADGIPPWVPIANLYQEHGVEAVNPHNEDFSWWGVGPRPDTIIPPVVVFIDEVHLLRSRLQQALLKATEPHDRRLQTEHMLLDCRYVCWLIATTDRGKLFDAFDSRFTKVNMTGYAFEERIKILQMHHPELGLNPCRAIAMVGGRVPRELLTFAKAVKEDMAMTGDTWDFSVPRIALERGRDPGGFTTRQIDVLTALGEKPVARGTLAGYVSCKEEELVNVVMLDLFEDRLVTTCSRGYAITKAGLKVLDERQVRHSGEAALV